MNGRQLDFLTRAGLVATVMAILAVLIPPASLSSAVAAIGFSGAAALRACGKHRTNRVALLCLAASVGLVVFASID